MKQNTPKVEDLIDTATAAKLLHTTDRTVRRMIEDGRLKSYARPIKTRGRQSLLVDRRQVEGLLQAVVEIERD